MSLRIEILVHLTHTIYALYTILMLLYTIRVINYTSHTTHTHFIYTFYYTVKSTQYANDIIHYLTILHMFTILGKLLFCLIEESVV